MKLLTGKRVDVQGFEFIMWFLWFAADEIFAPSIKNSWSIKLLPLACHSIMQFINLRGRPRGRLFIHLYLHNILFMNENAPNHVFLSCKGLTEHVYLITIIIVAGVCSARRSYYTNFSTPFVGGCFVSR